MAAARNQPTYDFLTGAPSSPPPPPPQPLRDTFRASQLIRPDHGNEELRAQINTLQYELESLKQERELTALRHQKEIRDVQNKAEADFRRAQASESNSHAVAAKYDSLAKELQETQDRSANERLDLERKLRTVQEQNRVLQEELEEAQAELSSQERQSEHRYNELQTRHDALQSTLDGLRTDLSAKVATLQTTQQDLSQQKAESGRLESELMRAKAQNEDTEALAVIKRELSEQVTHMKQLEATNRDQAAELKQYKKQHKSIEIVEEEKRVLEGKLRLMDDLRRQLGDADLRVRILEDERRSWTAYLDSHILSEGELQFESPEDMARAFVKERLEVASLLERLGAIQPELAVKEENVKALEEEKGKLLAEIDSLRTTGNAGDNKIRTRLERQRTLAVKEAEYLRAQLKAFDAEESEFSPQKHDEQKSQRIQELEDLTDEYRREIETLHADLSAAENRALQVPSPTIGSKRRRNSTDDERLGELWRKNRHLQNELSEMRTRNALLETDLKAHEAQLAALKASSRTRILELRANPTADAEALKLSTLDGLRKENKALLAQLEGRIATEDVDHAVIPLAALNSARAELASMASKLASAEKRQLRLKQIFSAKSLEFREAVASILGWKMDFMPNGRVRVTSMFYPGNEEEGEENSIVFDGENGTMKVSGGPQSEFAREIRGLIEFWVEERKEIPCFLAAMTLEFWERSTRAVRA